MAAQVAEPDVLVGSDQDRRPALDRRRHIAVGVHPDHVEPVGLQHLLAPVDLAVGQDVPRGDHLHGPHPGLDRLARRVRQEHQRLALAGEQVPKVAAEHIVHGLQLVPAQLLALHPADHFVHRGHRVGVAAVQQQVLQPVVVKVDQPLVLRQLRRRPCRDVLVDPGHVLRAVRPGHLGLVGGRRDRTGAVLMCAWVGGDLPRRAAGLRHRTRAVPTVRTRRPGFAVRDPRPARRGAILPGRSRILRGRRIRAPAERIRGPTRVRAVLPGWSRILRRHRIRVPAEGVRRPTRVLAGRGCGGRFGPR